MRTLSGAGISLIKRWEVLRLKAYRCEAGVWTIGYGHTGRDICEGLVITRAEAERFFWEDVEKHARIVLAGVKVPLSDNQFGALVSFAFTVGPGRKDVKDGFLTLKSGHQPTLLRKLNAGDYQGAADELPEWNRAAGRISNGLALRRADERRLFLLDVPTPGTV